MVIEPKTEWDGEGPRPVVAFAPGTKGLADHCAASRNIADGVGDYEQFFFHRYLDKGYVVVLTDYEGLGTPGMHTYMDRASQGHAVLDSIRAAQKLDGWDINGNNPVFMRLPSFSGHPISTDLVSVGEDVHCEFVKEEVHPGVPA
uniref:lipase family protein n=1 Tax=Corynebacterium macginleyi TaxID=38290 RepID=UPI001F1A7892|nr:lipase family protein [Corynebacterium macginleyi]